MKDEKKLEDDEHDNPSREFIGSERGKGGERRTRRDHGLRHNPRDEREVSRQPSDGEGGGGYEICIGLIDLP
jgi:hypothetical protein